MEISPLGLTFPSHSLNPFTSYKLRVKATNDIGDSDYSAETEAVTTLQDGEHGVGTPPWGECSDVPLDPLQCAFCCDLSKNPASSVGLLLGD